MTLDFPLRKADPRVMVVLGQVAVGVSRLLPVGLGGFAELLLKRKLSLPVL